MTTPKQKRKSTIPKKYKKEAAELIVNKQHTYTSLSEEIGIKESVLYTWVKGVVV